MREGPPKGARGPPFSKTPAGFYKTWPLNKTCQGQKLKGTLKGARAPFSENAGHANERKMKGNEKKLAGMGSRWHRFLLEARSAKHAHYKKARTLVVVNSIPPGPPQSPWLKKEMFVKFPFCPPGLPQSLLILFIPQ